MTTIRFTRSDDDATECLTLCRFTAGPHAGDHYSEWLDRETPFVVQVTTGPAPGDDLVGLYDLDGAQIPLGNGDEWEAVTEAPADVIAAVEEGWAVGDGDRRAAGRVTPRRADRSPARDRRR